MSRISGFPSGLLGLLDSKNFGQQPDELVDSITPVINLVDLFLTTKQVGAVQIVAAPANGINAGIVVPQGEVWRVHCGGVLSITNAFGSHSFTPVVESKGEGAIVLPIGETIVQAASLTRWSPMLCDPFYLKAGDQLSAYLGEVADTPTISIAYMVSKIRL